MKKRKSLMIIGTILMSLTFCVGCSSGSAGVGSRSTGVNSVDGDAIDRLPEDQKDTEIDKALARMRKSRKEKTEVKDGSVSTIAEVGINLPGQSKNIPDFGKESYEKLEERAHVINDYIDNELKVPKRPVYVHNAAPCLDPRMNAIYDDKDKGVASGYDNQNIYIEEYETEKDDVYSYLILVRDSKDSPWKVIHHGNSYKK
ncbi:hypothetical protein VT91_04150 [Clostridium sporogenes]|uniref:hypothetical protein n=1 Tax=Clostridium botulinum TaxID=1491 RepID=UPI000717AFD6|nr:hypothetical protein [Clostridium botulinum]KRU26798.1 hypothetical protein VT28_30230 [Clostridium sporogenes]KRU29662.1 hypothetical protein WG71_15070 [Clostridium sporogenes]KRU35427.1 hypothetical protein VT91_04150 [Clostridium sporogenes]KRU49652.1 hypothetical protein VT95_03190 [Clostridium sporogenes]MBZ1328451.1 hypothetical protein [Clostridium botulinum]